jgi:hypothetical protein
VDNREEVDAVLEQAQSAGATVLELAHERPWGIYSGYFRDRDGHLWKIIYNLKFVSSSRSINYAQGEALDLFIRFPPVTDR